MNYGWAIIIIMLFVISVLFFSSQYLMTKVKGAEIAKNKEDGESVIQAKLQQLLMEDDGA